MTLRVEFWVSAHFHTGNWNSNNCVVLQALGLQLFQCCLELLDRLQDLENAGSKLQKNVDTNQESAISSYVSQVTPDILSCMQN